MKINVEECCRKDKKKSYGMYLSTRIVEDIRKHKEINLSLLVNSFLINFHRKLIAKEKENKNELH